MQQKIMLVGLVLLLGLLFFSRLWGLANTPDGFHNDEASFLVNTKALLETGKDEDGQRWPLYLASYIDPKPALYSVLQLPSVAILGTTITAARLPSALLGIVGVLVLLGLFHHLKVGKLQLTVLAGLLVLSPWLLVVSRGTQEVIASFVFGVIALSGLVWLSKEWLQMTGRAKLFGLVLFLSSFFLSVYLYHSAKVVLPLLVGGVLWWSCSWKMSKVFLSLIGVGSFLAVMAVTMVGSAGLDRFNDINVLTSGDVFLVLDEQLRVASADSPVWQNRLLHNKLVNTGGRLTQVYFEHLTPGFLFFGQVEPQRYVVPFQGLLYLVELPLLLLGIGIALFTAKNSPAAARRHIFFGWWLLVSPVPAVFTDQEIPSMIRTFWLVVPLLYFIAIGLSTLIEESIKVIQKSSVKRLLAVSDWPHLLPVGLLVVVAASYLWGGLYFWHHYAIFQAQFRPWHRNVADQAMANKLVEIEKHYSSVEIGRFSGQPYVYVVLAGLISVPELQQNYPARLAPDFTIGKYSFTASHCPLGLDPETLYVVREQCEYPAYYQVVATAPYRDKNAGYVFLEFDAEKYAALHAGLVAGE